MPTTILLTGANGFLGSHIVRELLARRYNVRALVRPGSNRKTLPELPIEIVEGDLLNPADVLRAAKGCKAVIHAAALAQVNPARDPQVWAVNKTGTENVLAAVKQAGLKRLVYVGTANVFGFGTKEQPGTERSPYTGQTYGVDYMDSKVAATELVRQAAHRDDVAAIMVHPTFLLGPLDSKPTSGAMLLAIAKKQLPGYPAGGKNYVHVRDAAIATVNALTMGRLGESYILGNENLTYHEAFALMASVAGVTPPHFALPPTVARFYAQASQWLANIRGRVPAVNVPMAMIANDGHYFSSEKAVRELNLPQTPIREAVQEAYDWFSANGYLR
ncbi:NAD-dependent epimerase/dehydratase family protein [Fibrella aquatilis]|uniref:NAD-dependent epimerase/dehydratase family protein n=1 Tax=Fibrella aquatilis TaxID=2817059 RepID=A0A939G9A9_9BACT|nr:NAD-dependent epimerase/dehydratase family protein [Fibrella aquatilis]MBO0932193.1 NAD-dependent epimerase/dehydratase family protein [Fibrella aquatilis]